MVSRLRVLLIVGFCVAEIAGSARHPAAAITAELAKQCRALMLKAHPYVLPGHKGPAGLAEIQRNYFKQCVANNGNMPAEPEKKNPSENNPGGNNPGGNNPTENNPTENNPH